MTARYLTTAALFSAMTAVLPARAADPQLLNLVMPDAKVLAGVNVDQAKVTPLGQYLTAQMQSQDSHIQELTALTGFDPTRDVHEILAATTGDHTGLFLARGDFDPAKIIALATVKGEAVSEYNGVTIVSDKEGKGGFAFLSSTIFVAGDIASLKAAIDRQKSPSNLPAAVSVRVSQWSGSQDAWAITTVPPGSLHPNPGMPPIPGVGPGGKNNAFANIQQAAGGVKLGAQVVVTGQAEAATAQDASQIGDALKLLASLAQLQANADPNVLAVAQSLNVTTSGNLLNAAISVPQETLIKVVESGHKKPAARKPAQRRM